MKILKLVTKLSIFRIYLMKKINIRDFYFFPIAQSFHFSKNLRNSERFVKYHLLKTGSKKHSRFTFEPTFFFRHYTIHFSWLVNFYPMNRITDTDCRSASKNSIHTLSISHANFKYIFTPYLIIVRIYQRHIKCKLLPSSFYDTQIFYIRYQKTIYNRAFKVIISNCNT